MFADAFGPVPSDMLCRERARSGACRSTNRRDANERIKRIRDRGVTVAATVLVVLSGVAAWWCFAQWRLGRVELTNDGPPLVAQILGESSDEPVVEPFDVVTRFVLTSGGRLSAESDRYGAASAGLSVLP